MHSQKIQNLHTSATLSFSKIWDDMRKIAIFKFWQDFTLKSSNLIQIQKNLILKEFNVYATEKSFVVIFAHKF